MIVIAAEVYAFPMEEVRRRGTWPNFRGLRELGAEVRRHHWSTRSNPLPVATSPAAGPSHRVMAEEAMVIDAPQEPHEDEGKGKGKGMEGRVGEVMKGDKGKGKAKEIERGRSASRPAGSRGQSGALSKSHPSKGQFKSVELIPTDSEDGTEVTPTSPTSPAPTPAPKPPKILIPAPTTKASAAQISSVGCDACTLRGLNCTMQPQRACAECRSAKCRCSLTPGGHSSSKLGAKERGRSKSRPPPTESTAPIPPPPSRSQSCSQVPAPKKRARRVPKAFAMPSPPCDLPAIVVQKPSAPQQGSRIGKSPSLCNIPD